MIENSNADAGYYNFLLSNWYSGATVLSILLNNHKAITCNGETFPFPDQNPDELRCSCGETLTDCEFYKYSANHFRLNKSYNQNYFGCIPVISEHKIFQHVFESFTRLTKIRDAIFVMTPGSQDKINTFINWHEKFFNQACKFDNSKVYLDGTKSIRRVELFAKYRDKPIRIIHCIRDGRKFIPTYIKVANLTEEDIPKAAQQWIDYIKMVKELKKRYPKIQIKTIRHEDLCHDKEAAVKEICNFLGVEYDQNIFDFNNANYHILGNNMRYKFDGAIFENDKWKNYYSKETFDKTTELLKPYLKEYGYL